KPCFPFTVCTGRPLMAGATVAPLSLCEGSPRRDRRAAACRIGRVRRRDRPADKRVDGRRAPRYRSPQPCGRCGAPLLPRTGDAVSEDAAPARAADTARGRSPVLAVGADRHAAAVPSGARGFLDLDTWRLRVWYPALEAAGLQKRGPYEMRHTFASEALAAGVSIFQLSRLMGASVGAIGTHYRHLVRDSDGHLRQQLGGRSGF